MLTILDLFCGAGGASEGYFQAGFDVVGVDIKPQPHYPYKFFQADALTVSTDGFDAIHASPPCQRHSRMSGCRPGLSDTYPDLIAPIRAKLQAAGVPWVIENVPGSPLENPVTLCGQMFGLELYRHRLFETSFPISVPDHPPHTVPASKAGHWKPGTIMSVAGKCYPKVQVQKAMGINWMTTEEMSESIPPAYTRFIGERLSGLILQDTCSHQWSERELRDKNFGVCFGIWRFCRKCNKHQACCYAEGRIGGEWKDVEPWEGSTDSE